MAKAIRNAEIRKLLSDTGIKHFEAAEACGVTCYTFSHWLQTELTPEKKDKVLNAIRTIKR